MSYRSFTLLAKAVAGEAGIGTPLQRLREAAPGPWKRGCASWPP
jgi:hypothetical protein